MAIRGKWNHEENTAAEFQLRDTARRRNTPLFLQQQADPIVSRLLPKRLWIEPIRMAPSFRSALADTKYLTGKTD
jgi:hypothetical protein